MMHTPVFLSRLLSRPVTFALTALTLLSASGQSPRVALTTLAPQALVAATDGGAVPASQPMTLTLTLSQAPARAAALDSFLTALTTASSGSYHQWITPQQFAAAYGASADQLAAASVWVQSQGLTVAGVSAGGMRITVTGSAAQVQAAFAVSIDNFTQSGYGFYANTTQPTLPVEVAPLFVAIGGLTNVPADARTLLGGPSAVPATLVNGQPSAQDVATLGAIIDANATPILTLDSTFGVSTLTQADLNAYSILFKQAAAQGVTTLLARTASSLGFPSMLPEVTALALAGDMADQQTSTTARPQWQFAPGLPADGLRHGPDVTAALTDFTAAMTQIAAGSRLGNINPVLYELAPSAGLFDQAGTWKAGSGLGQVDLKKLAKAYPRGTGMSYTSFQATNYSPTHGQGTSFTSNVTSGTGGATPTGTVSFVTSAGVVLGTSTLVNGSGSITINTLDGGNYTVDAVYSGDGTYASSTSPTAQLFVQPEASALTASIGGNPTIGGSYTVTVTDTAPSGVGTPTGPITVTVSGTSNIYNATLTASGTASSSATVTIPATAAGTLTLSIQCTTTPNYSCYNPYTTTVTIAKATPTLTISSSPSTLVSGETVTLNAAVSTVGAAPAPTGAVTFFDNGTTLNAGQLTNGSTTTTGTVPTTATHSLSATYAGDSNYNSVSTTAGTSSSGTITTTLNLQSSASVVTAGQTITFTATLTAASSGPANPTGTVTFFDGATTLATANLSGNVATFATSTLSATTNHTITAVYSGDGYYSGSTSNAVGLSSNNTSNATTTTLVVSPTNPVHGTTVTFTATVAGPSGGATPTGTVTFTSAGSGTLGTATLMNGVATFTTNQLSGGTMSYTASYSGSSTYNASFSTASTVTVTPEPVTLTITPPVNPTFGSTLSVTVQVVGASGVSYPQGTVTVTPQGSGYSAASSAGVTSGGTNSTGSATVLVQATGAGSVTFTATYTGDKNFAAAGPVSSNVTVAKAASTTTVSFSPTQPVAGQPTTVSAQVGFVSSIAPTGTVQFFNGTALLGTATLGSNGSASISTTFSAGNQVVTAVYSGDTNYAGSTSAPANTNLGTTASATTLVLSATSVAAGSTVQLFANVTPTAATGSVQFVTGSTVLCTATVTGGAAACSYMPTTAGAFAIVANYLGDGTYAPSSSTAMTLTVTGTAARIGTTTVLTPTTTGGVTTLTATVTPAAAGSAAISGTVAFYDGTTLLGTGTVTGSTTLGTASITASFVSTTGHTLTAVYSGDTVYYPSTSAAVTTVTGKIATTTVVVASTGGTTGTTTLTATVTAASVGAAAPTGTVTFYDGTTPIGVALVSAGSAAVSVTLSATATHSITAVYSGDVNYAPSTSAAITGVITPVGKVTPSILLTVNPNSGLTGAAVTLSATVFGVSTTGAAPTGTVTFFAIGTFNGSLGVATLGATGAGVGTAVLSVTIPSGTSSLYAVYGGDANFNTVTSNSVTFSGGTYSLTFTPQSLTLNPGQTGTATIGISSVNNFAGAVYFGCTPAPNSGITCSITPTFANGAGNVTLTINTVAPMAKTTQQATSRSGKVVGGLSLAAVLCWLLPAGRRRRIPAMLLVLLALSLAANLGCSDNSFTFATPTGGTPLGTSVVIITVATTSGTQVVQQNYPYQVTIQ